MPRTSPKARVHTTRFDLGFIARIRAALAILFTGRIDACTYVIERVVQPERCTLHFGGLPEQPASSVLPAEG